MIEPPHAPLRLAAHRLKYSVTLTAYLQDPFQRVLEVCGEEAAARECTKTET
jgi:hypothetical protein